MDRASGKDDHPSPMSVSQLITSPPKGNELDVQNDLPDDVNHTNAKDNEPLVDYKERYHGLMEFIDKTEKVY